MTDPEKRPSVLLITPSLLASDVAHTVRTIHTMALAGRVQYGGCADVLKAPFVRVQCNSTQLSISLSQVTVSRESCCSGTKRHRGAGPHASPVATSPAPQLTHDSCVTFRVKWAAVL